MWYYIYIEVINQTTKKAAFMTTQDNNSATEHIETKENISIMFGETHLEACYDDFEVTEGEYQMVLKQLATNNAEYYEDILDILANNFRIDASNMNVINEGYYVPVADVWYADANYAVLMLVRSKITVSGIEDAISAGHVVHQSPFPKNPRFQW